MKKLPYGQDTDFKVQKLAPELSEARNLKAGKNKENNIFYNYYLNISIYNVK